MKLSTFVFVLILASLYTFVVFDLMSGSGRNGDNPIDRKVVKLDEKN